MGGLATGCAISCPQDGAEPALAVIRFLFFGNILFLWRILEMGERERLDGPGAIDLERGG